MATRDEIIRFLIETEGQRELQGLGKEIEGVAKSGDAAENELRKFTAELDKLKAVERQVRELSKLQLGLDKTGDSLRTAEQRLNTLQAEFDQTSNPTAKLSRELEKARTEVGRLADQQNRQRTALQQTTAALKAQGVDTTRLGDAQKRVRTEVTDLTTRFRDYATRTREAAAAQRSLKESAEQGFGVLGKLRGLLAGLGVALGFREAVRGVKAITDIGDAAESSRGRLEVLFGSVEAGNRAFDTLRGVAVDTGQEFQTVEEAATRLKRFGIDPLDGTLTALIDQNAKFQGSNEDLLRTVDKLGAAYTRNKLSQRDVVALAQQGIPVFDLLAKATGRTAAEFEELARKGKLGRDEIQILIRQIGQDFAGGAKENLSQLSTVVQQLKNQWNDFLLRVADSGVLDFAKRKLSEITAEIQRLTANGDLQRYAQSVADGIVRTGEAIGSAIQFVRDYSGALILLGKAYLAIKFAPFIAGLAASAQGMVAAAAQARTLTGVVGGLGARLAAIPSNIKIAIGIVAFDQLITQFGRLQDAISEYRETLNEVELFEAGQRQLARDRITLIEQIIQTYGKYAETQIKTQEQLNTLGEGDILLYRQRLEAAERYFVAVQAKAKEANDAAGLSEAQAKIRELREALAAVAKAYDGIRDARKRAFEDAASGENAVQQALKDLGVSAQNMGQQFTEQGTKITEAFSVIALGLNTTAAQIGEAFSNALNQTQTTAEVERLQNALEEAFRRGKIGAEQFGALMDAAKLKIKGIEEGAAKAAGSFKQVAEAGEEALRALLATLDVSRGQLAAKANQLGAKIGQALAAGLDAGPLKAELAGVESQINSTTVQINDTKAALDRFSASSDRAANSLGNISGAAAGASGALQGVEKAADESFGNIGQGASTVAGGPLAALGAEFGRIRDKALALGDAAKEAFDSTLRVGETVRGTGFTIEQFYQRQIDRLKLATDTVEELERAYNNSARSAQSLATASADIAKNSALSLEAERERNLEYARQLLEVEKERESVQRASTASLGQQVQMTRELATTRENLPPQRIELVAANQQKPGELLGELSERDIGRLAELVVQRLAISRRGVF